MAKMDKVPVVDVVEELHLLVAAEEDLVKRDNPAHIQLICQVV